jgi:hypothetical protein
MADELAGILVESAYTVVAEVVYRHWGVACHLGLKSVVGAASYEVEFVVEVGAAVAVEFAACDWREEDHLD